MPDIDFKSSYHVGWVLRDEVSKDKRFALVCLGNDIAFVFSEFKLRVYCYAKVTSVINMSDMNVVNDEIGRLLMRSNGENATF